MESTKKITCINIQANSGQQRERESNRVMTENMRESIEFHIYNKTKTDREVRRFESS